jgi:hypothetical protein
VKHESSLSVSRLLLVDLSDILVAAVPKLDSMLSAARDSERSPDTGDLLLQIKLVAGARNHLNLEFAWAAA